tara:strand:+ start:307 stop:900 length:594 start_codon:yes stop_codon:yes gene_type:complete
MSLAVVGGLRLSNFDTLSKEINKSREGGLLLNNIINDLGYSMEIDSSFNYEQFIIKFYSKHSLEFPDIAPVDGYVTRGLQLESNHLGIDIATKYKEEVYCPSDGRVLYAGGSDVFGKTIIITHPGGFITIFGHNDTMFVKPGELVEKKQLISLVGETGNSEGPHLHYEVWKNNKVLDPREIVPEYKRKDVSISETRK